MRPSDTALIGLGHSRAYSLPVRGALDVARAADAPGIARANHALDAVRAGYALGTTRAGYTPGRHA